MDERDTNRGATAIMDDEVLELTPWPIPRWVIAVGAAGLLVAGTVFLARSSEHAVAPLTAPAANPSLAVVPPAAGPELVLDRSTLLVLDRGNLFAFDAPTGRLLDKAAAPTGSPNDPGATARLALDASAAIVWVVMEDAFPTTAVEYSLPGLRRVREVSLRAWVSSATVSSAAALAGHLYLSTDVGLVDLAPNAWGAMPIPGLYGAVGPVAADPSRKRIVAIDLGYPTDVWSYQPGKAPIEAERSLRIADGTLAIVAGEIWVGGHDGARPTLLHLDPRTLAPMSAAVPAGVGSGVRLIATGGHVVWLRGPTLVGNLWCIDADTARPLQRWALAGNVTSSSGTAFVGIRAAVRPLTLSGCSG